MRFEWYVVRYHLGEMVWKSPHGMTKAVAKLSAIQRQSIPGNRFYKFKVIHKKDL